MADSNRYWVFDWFDENHITSLDEAAPFLPKYRVLDSLHYHAAEAKKGDEISLAPARTSIVAGTGVDLSGGGMVCSSPQCLRLQVDKLLRHVWHYFDKVVADDVLTPLLTDEWSGSKKELVDLILQQLSPLIYLREIGASELIDFRPKGHCAEHWQTNAESEGLGLLLRSKQDFIHKMAETATVSKAPDNGPDVYDIGFPEAGVGALMSAHGLDEWQVKCKAAAQAFEMYMVDLVADVSASHTYGLPLGSADFFVGRMLEMSRRPSEAEVMFELQLPVLHGLPPKELIALRKEEAEYFDRFRSALRLAAAERIRTQSDSSATRIADEIRADLIEPELIRIKTRLTAAEKLMKNKASLSIFLGMLATSCSLLAGVAPVVAVPAGVAVTLGGVGPAAAKHLDSESEIKLSDMYFLWKAVGHAH